MKLSKTQLTILRRLDGGDVVEYVRPPIDRFVWVGDLLPNPRKRSIEILVNFGLVKVEQDAWWGKSYIITFAGRDYLESLE